MRNFVIYVGHLMLFWWETEVMMGEAWNFGGGDKCIPKVWWGNL